MAGFRGPLLPLALSAVVATQAGYRQPLPIPPVSGTPASVQAGYRQPLPIPPVAGSVVVEPPAEDIRPVVRYGDDWIETEDEELMLIITAFLATRR